MARALLENHDNITMGDRERLFGYVDGSGRIILPEPQALLTPASKMPASMDRKCPNPITTQSPCGMIPRMSKRSCAPCLPTRRGYGVATPVIRINGPVWQLHQVYSDEATKDWVQQGCRSAGIGCIDCKQPVIKAVLAELAPMQERARELEANPDTVRNIVEEGCEAARETAAETLEEVRNAMGLKY